MSSEPLGLFAVFYDGETRPVAGFVLEQDAERYAKEYSGGGESTYEIKHVNVIATADLDAARSAGFAQGIERACQHLKNSADLHRRRLASEIRALSPDPDLASRLRAEGWQPIETAPKNETRVLVLTDVNEVVIGHFSKSLSTWHEDDGDFIYAPQSWMPLPDPPTDSTANEGGEDE